MHLQARRGGGRQGGLRAPLLLAAPATLSLLAWTAYSASRTCLLDTMRARCMATPRGSSTTWCMRMRTGHTASSSAARALQAHMHQCAELVPRARALAKPAAPVPARSCWWTVKAFYATNAGLLRHQSWASRGDQSAERHAAQKSIGMTAAEQSICYCWAHLQACSRHPYGYTSALHKTVIE